MGCALHKIADMTALAHPPSSKVRALADKLIGTIGPADLVDQVEDLSIEECKDLDALVFECTCCGWWCTDRERNIINDEWVCDECALV